MIYHHHMTGWADHSDHSYLLRASSKAPEENFNGVVIAELECCTVTTNIALMLAVS